METFERIVRFQPAYDKRDSDPHKDYGIHGVTMRMVLKGEKGAVHFVLFTGWHLPHVAAELKSRGSAAEPYPADVGYHSPTPRYEGHLETECDILPGGKCYGDGSTLAADDAFVILVTEGGESLWEYLKNYYRQTFGE